MSRAPRKEIRKSNAHFRFGRGPAIATLIVRSRKPLSRPQMLALALREAKKKGASTKVYVVRRLAARQAFSGMANDELVPVEHGVLAAEAYLLTGKNEQAVRGVTLDGLDLRALKDVLGLGADPYVMNLDQMSGASIIAPALLLDRIDVKRHEADNPKPPSYAQP